MSIPRTRSTYGLSEKVADSQYHIPRDMILVEYIFAKYAEQAVYSVLLSCFLMYERGHVCGPLTMVTFTDLSAVQFLTSPSLATFSSRLRRCWGLWGVSLQWHSLAPPPPSRSSHLGISEH